MKITKLKLERAILQGQIAAARTIAVELPIIIRERVRSGIGLSGTFKSLSEKYISLRRKARRLSSETTPDTSNLTATGQLLNSIKGLASRTVIKIFIKDKRGRDLSGNASKVGNNKVREYVEKERPFFELTANERKYVEQTAAEIIKQQIRRSLR